jgi:hypothetical protein
MSDNERQPGQAGEGVSKEDLSFERLRILMSYDDGQDPIPLDLAEAWVPVLKLLEPLWDWLRTNQSIKTP